jgi:hypothetical protein
MGLGRGDQLHDHLVETSGRPRQLAEMWLNSRCSILFHLEVPGGKWHTVTCRPISAANRASSGLLVHIAKLGVPVWVLGALKVFWVRCSV